MSYYITKANGEREKFNLKKLNRSLYKAGADTATRKEITDYIFQARPKTTTEIYKQAMQLLRKEKYSPIATKYNMKQALMNFGPAGFPFEKYVAHLLHQLGYETTVDTIVKGACISHEIDIIAQKDNQHVVIECKFHHAPGLRSDVKVALYSKARFDDILQALKLKETKRHHVHEPWIITNTKFTSTAIAYSKCAQIRLIGWSYPEKGNLPDLIDQFALHPITALPSLTAQQKQQLLAKGIVLCRQAAKNPAAFRSVGISDRMISRLTAEAAAVCQV